MEAVPGIIKQKYRILDHRVDEDLLPKIPVLARIASSLNNTFGKRLRSDQTMFGEVVGRMMQMRSVPNTLAEEAEANRWNLVRRSWIPAASDSVPDFPKITEEELKIFFTGTYQLSQSISYLAELINDDNTIKLRIHRENSTIFKMKT